MSALLQKSVRKMTTEEWIQVSMSALAIELNTDTAELVLPALIAVPVIAQLNSCSALQMSAFLSGKVSAK